MTRHKFDRLWSSKTHLVLIGGCLCLVLITGIYKAFWFDGNGLGENRVAKTYSGIENFIKTEPAKMLPAVVFYNDAGEEIGLEAFRGRVVLVNLWATWCLPCREEMPALDRLQAALGGPDFEVVAININRQGRAVAEDFLDEIGVQHLAFYNDATAKIRPALRGFGLPVSILVDRETREIGRLIGPAEWDAPEFEKLIKAAMAG